MKGIFPAINVSLLPTKFAAAAAAAAHSPMETTNSNNAELLTLRRALHALWTARARTGGDTARFAKTLTTLTSGRRVLIFRSYLRRRRINNKVRYCKNIDRN